jgi:hypothetical protein
MIGWLNEINDPYESEYYKTKYQEGPKLMLCDYCKKEYVIPGYVTN